jgi:hypothetical protein
MADNIFKRWTSKRVRELAAPGASLAEIAGMLARTESAPMDRSELGSPASVNKITWQKAGRVTEPGLSSAPRSCVHDRSWQRRATGVYAAADS